mmetsp:Transcript_12762/g.21550  ORF Transcript_12762/g.21550 Transcript_12762/m.21550 type:complete len:138 (-) Transcript_12762:124-537(-)
MQRKIEIAASASMQCSGGDFIVCGRTDTRGVEGLEATIERSKAYIDAGADMIFPEGLKTIDEFRYVSQELRSYREGVYLLANMTEFGKTELIDFEHFSEAGFSCVIYPVSTLRVSMKAVVDLLQDIKSEGSQRKQLG